MHRRLQQSARTRSTQSRGNQSSFGDLITHTQNAISSQATVYTSNSQRNFTQNEDMDDFDDIINQQIDTLFITPEEQKKIQGILEFARKGKITANNAFEVPMRVVDAGNNEASNLRFWKFASELLGASMSIYDKRVENVFTSTNRMFDSLMRMGSFPEDEVANEESQDVSRNHRAELMRISIQEFKSNQNVGLVGVGKNTLQQPDKLDIKDMQGQFITDPLFYKKLKTFDSDTLKSLFMNVFQCGKQQEVKLFNKKDSQDRKDQANQYGNCSFPDFLQNELTKVNFIAKSSNGFFHGIDEFKRKNLKQEGIDADHFNHLTDYSRGEGEALTNFQQQFGRQFGSGFRQVIDLDSNSHMNSDNFDMNLLSQFPDSQSSQKVEQMVCLSERIPLTSSDLHFNDFFVNSYFSQDHQQDEDAGYLTVMTPWQLEFRGLKLQKRKIKAASKKREVKQKANAQISFTDFGDFGDFSKLNRQDIFEMKQSKSKNSEKAQNYGNKKKQKLNDKFIMQMPMEVYGTYYSHYNIHSRKAGVKSSNDENVDIFNQVTQPVSQMKLQTLAKIQDQPETEAFDENLVSMQKISSEGMNNYKMFGLRNIRDIKQAIYELIVRDRSVRMSQLGFFGVSFQSMMVIFLHLVNEKNLSIFEQSQQTDIRLQLRSN